MRKWVSGFLIFAVVAAIIFLSWQIYIVCVDPRTEYHRWTLIDGQIKTLAMLGLVLCALILDIRFTALKAKMEAARAATGVSAAADKQTPLAASQNM